MTRELEALNGALDSEPWLTLMALADLHEERGEQALALGYRWLAKRRKRPIFGYSRRYYWQLVDDIPPRPGPKRPLNKRTAFAWDFPSKLSLMGQEKHGLCGHGPEPGFSLLFPTASAAYRAAAQAVGQVLLKEKS